MAVAPAQRTAPAAGPSRRVPSRARGPNGAARGGYWIVTTSDAVAVWWVFLVESVTFTTIGNEAPGAYFLRATFPASSPWSSI